MRFPGKFYPAVIDGRFPNFLLAGVNKRCHNPICMHSGIFILSLQAKNSYLISVKCIASNEFAGYVELTSLSDFCEFWLRRKPAKTEIRLTLNINRSLSVMSFSSDSVFL